MFTETIEEKLTVGAAGVPITVMVYSTSKGGATAPLAVVPALGGVASDFADVAGKIAVVRRGSCSFGQKAATQRLPVGVSSTRFPFAWVPLTAP
ncbi:hypothetical protein GCM10027445_38460 [Amycolatopsis endophytica]